MPLKDVFKTQCLTVSPRHFQAAMPQSILTLECVSAIPQETKLILVVGDSKRGFAVKLAAKYETFTKLAQTVVCFCTCVSLRILPRTVVYRVFWG